MDDVIVVTGGASGIGLALARAFGTGPSKAVLLVDRDAEALDDAASRLREEGLTVTTRVVDLRDAGAVDELAAAASGLGRLRVACLNAGVSAFGDPLWETPSEVFDFVLGVNLGGLVNSIRTLVPLLIEQGTPADIVITASMAGLVASPTSGAYGASKAAAVSVARTLRAELDETHPHVRVTALAPGMVSTNLQLNSAEQQRDLAPDRTAVEQSHQALADLGVAPEEAAAWAADAVWARRFWAVPPSTDMFAGQP